MLTMFSNRTINLGGIALTLILTLGFPIGVWFLTWTLAAPQISNVLLEQPGEPALSVSLPLSSKYDLQDFSVSFDLLLDNWVGQQLAFRVDDCIDRILVNGHELKERHLPICAWSTSVPYNLAPYLKQGINHIKVYARNTGGRADFNIAPLVNFWQFIIAIFLGALSIFIFIYRFSRLTRLSNYLWIILAAGITLRFWYYCVTLYESRAHDWEGHLEYVQYVALNWSIPPNWMGWEMFQSPLYYFLAAVPYRLFNGQNQVVVQNIIPIVQALSFVLTSGVLLIILWIADMIFRGNQRLQALLLASVAFSPGLVFFASRISNDVLQHFLSYLTFGLALGWWISARDSLLISGAVTTALGFLTKIGEAIFAPFAVILILFKSDKDWSRKLKLILVSALIFIVTTAWYTEFRIRYSEPFEQTWTSPPLNQALQVSNNLSDYLTFNPIAILNHPFNDTVSPNSRREFIWEFLFRSAYFGEFNFIRYAPLIICQAILFSGMLLLPLAAIGVFRYFKQKMKERAPIPLIALLLFGSVLSYRISLPFACNQDFRFISLVLLPIVIMILDGTEILPSRIRQICHGVFVLHIMLSAVFLLRLIFGEVYK